MTAAERGYDPLADDLDDEHLETADHSARLFADEIRSPARAFGAAVPTRRPYLRDDTTIVIDGNRGRHREPPRRPDWTTLGLRTAGAIMITVGLAMNATLCLAFVHRIELPTADEAFVLTAILCAFTLMFVGLLMLTLVAMVTRAQRRIARFGDAIATAGFRIEEDE